MPSVTSSAEDEANEEAAAVGEIDASRRQRSGRRAERRNAASDQVGSIVDSVAADEGSFEAAAAGEIESLEDAAEASDDNEAAASEAIAEVVEAVAAAEQSEEAAAVAEIEEIVDEVNASEFTGETAAEATVESIVDDVNADEYSEETAAAAVVDEIVNTVAADEGFRGSRAQRLRSRKSRRRSPVTKTQPRPSPRRRSRRSPTRRWRRTRRVDGSHRLPDDPPLTGRVVSISYASGRHPDGPRKRSYRRDTPVRHMACWRDSRASMA